MHQISELKSFSSRRAVVFAQPIDAGSEVENEDVDGAAMLGYIWVINNFMDYKGVAYIRGLMVAI